METEAKRQALDALVAPRLLIIGEPVHGFETSELIEIAHKGLLSSPRTNAPTAEDLVEYLWEDLVEYLPDGGHIRVTSLSQGTDKRVLWNGNEWHELTELEITRYRRSS